MCHTMEYRLYLHICLRSALVYRTIKTLTRRFQVATTKTEWLVVVQLAIEIDYGEEYLMQR